MVPDLPARCVIVSRLFRPAFLFRCALLAQRSRSVRLVSRSSCVARSAFPSRPLRRPFTTRVFASSVPFPVALRVVRPSFPSRPLRLPFHRASSTQSFFSGCLYSCLVSRCFEARQMPSPLCYSLSPSNSLLGNFFSALRRLDYQVVVIWVRYNPHFTCLVESYSSLIN